MWGHCAKYPLSFCAWCVFQPLVQPLQERMEHLVCQSAACAASLEQAQLLLAQYVEAHEELSPWLEETQHMVEQLSPESLSCEAFKEQQEVLQGLREAIAEHKPLMAKLQRVCRQLAILSPQEAAPFLQDWQAAEDQYGRIREDVRQAAAVLEEAIPRYSQVREGPAGLGVTLWRRWLPIQAGLAAPPLSAPAQRGQSWLQWWWWWWW
ncbi:hypothetical protein JD844_015333 [Phrynosoma platyrhinos]|uniref:Uncharacterized protein n=1 Tax=Phrynosoma platyrhinos TaxID=52577 RepID=A0ABQ7SJ81_PHRPL|nr:hypothetical protein JD844_015333 [Phrynosoma platyrhinos]